jgi:poly(A) polymerase
MAIFFKEPSVMMSFDWIQQEPYLTLFSVVPDPSWLRIVGGAVRNTLLGLPVSDVDIATRYTPDEIMDYYRQKGFDVIPTGLSHGTVTVRLLGHTFEITTLRCDVHTDGRHATVAFTDSWVQDAQRRDFTINALYVDSKGVLYDDVGGLNDLSKSVLRFIGCPTQRIQEDYLRILRFFRFWAAYARTPDPASLQACIQWKQGLYQLSKERITSEILKILALDHPWGALQAMAEHGILALINGQEQSQCWTDDLERVTLLEKLEKQWGIKAPPMVRLWALMRSHRIGHTPALMLLSNKQRQELGHLDRATGCGLDEWDLFYRTNRETVRSCVWAEAFMVARQEAHPLSDQARSCLQAYCDVHQRLLWQEFPPFELSGHDIMALGVAGSDVGRILTEVKNRWVHHRGTIPPKILLHHLWNERSNRTQVPD